MTKRKDTSARRRKGYAADTHRPLNCLAFILLPLLFFQVGAGYYGTNLFAARDLNKLLRYFGGTAPYLPAVLVIVVMLIQHMARRDPWKVQGKVLAGMLGEAALWAAPLVAMNYLAQLALAAAAAENSHAVLQKLLPLVGAGVYEEFLFRLLLISLILLIFVDIFELKKEIILIAAVALSGVLFGLYHFSWDQITGQFDFPWREFIFLFLAGIYLAGLFILRGFGVCVGAHILYNGYALATGY